MLESHAMKGRMNMRKFRGFAALLLALVMGMTVLAAQAESDDLLSEIKSRGEIVVATEGAWAPWTYHDEQGTLVGFDVEVMQAIAAKLGVTATFAETEWDGIFAGLDSGRYDIAANGVEVTDERAQKYDFSTPYGYIRTALIVRGDNTDIQSFEDLKGKHTANSIASTYMTLAESYGATAAGVDTLDQTIQMVLSGRADATLNAEVSLHERASRREPESGGPDGRGFEGVPAHAQGRALRLSAGGGQSGHRRAGRGRRADPHFREILRQGYYPAGAVREAFCMPKTPSLSREGVF